MIAYNAELGPRALEQWDCGKIMGESDSFPYCALPYCAPSCFPESPQECSPASKAPAGQSCAVLLWHLVLGGRKPV